jgi:vacuolar protein sorting-associated protein IST1
MLLKEIAKEHNVDWDSTSFESLLIKPPEDLLVRPFHFQKSCKLVIEFVHYVCV